MGFLHDYTFRGPYLDYMNLFDFILNTYEDIEHAHAVSDGVVPYLPGSRKRRKVRVVRPHAQEVVPEVIGGWPPALDDCGDKGLYEASILLLFCPWRDIKHLKNGHDTFADAFMDFEKRMPNDVRERIDNIQSYYECRWGYEGSTDIG